ncbi:methionine synthase [Tsukamurella sp. 8F]|uniref:methionine synthase n=1 Tax=Tsukamurella sp. 8F TaxID=3031961 RepID=UPI0023B9F285|nr:methionine synthase [Tsukamurella sp. 8F]MDF0586076.1 methionine synthase [Tsukamurella sp. 8F]
MPDLDLAGAATGIGSHPGTDPRAAAEIVVGEVALPYVPELPARGLGADMIGRGAGLLVDVPLDVSTTGYRIGGPKGAVGQKASDLLRRDVDAFEEAYEVAGLRGTGRVVKVQAAGPLTLAASLELVNGHRAARDPGARRDIAESLAEGLRGYAADVAGRCGASVVVQLDEPMLGTVLTGRIPALTRLDPIPALPVPDATDLLNRVVDGLETTLLHVCGDVDWAVVRGTHVDGVCVDVTRLSERDYDGIGEFVESSRLLALGLVPAVPAGRAPVLETVLEPAVRLYDAVGLPRAAFARTVVSPACGLAGAPDAYVRPALALATRAAEALYADPAAL